jgi:radical SAM protein with 4Fe4S-binding SPASM domain
VPAADTGAEPGFVDYCLEERILVPAPGQAGRSPCLKQSPIPSLRYLLLHITDRCNLRCRHCFLGEVGTDDLDIDRVAAVVDQFEDMQGLRLMVSGGEPLLHREFSAINEFLRGKDLRTILLTNGTLLDERLVGMLGFAEVQVSLDGLEASHDFLRGAGSFQRSLAGIRLLREAGTQVSVATMIHQNNLEDFDRLEELVGNLGVREWSVDLPSPVGRLAVNRELSVDPQTAGPLLGRSWGGAIHEPAAGYACGAHLMAVMADGAFSACGFYGGQPLGSIENGLAAAWQQKPRVALADLECDCQFVEDCRGGCRFRAAGYNTISSPDLCQCYRYGVR